MLSTYHSLPAISPPIPHTDNPIVNSTPRLILAGLSGGAGKTIISLGLARAFVHQGLRVMPFKKGPDYIDAAWLSLAAGNEASNLDPFLMPKTALEDLFARKSAQADMAVIEGNRGIFDGKDTSGSYSTAELAKLLQCPVILIINCTKMTRTVAAMIQGCLSFEPAMNLAGVILNRTAGQRHRTILRQCIEQYTNVPVVGILPKITPDPIPERHMGLVSDQECAEAESTLNKLADIARECLDIDKLKSIANSAPGMEVRKPTAAPRVLHHKRPVSIGVIRDAALWFYYQENLEELRTCGAKIVRLSLLSEKGWPDIHGLYLGGGFPETQARLLAENQAIRSRVKMLADDGLPIYAECGGFMYLGENLICQEKMYPMAGVFAMQTMLCAKPQGHGYTVARVSTPNPFHPVGLEFTGHEFHYSKCVTPLSADMEFTLEMKRGWGIDAKRDGLLYRNTFACYTHLHALGVPSWAPNFVQAAREYKNIPPEKRQYLSVRVAIS
jgi:cobyrinic acid a,c-diamide synthase